MIKAVPSAPRKNYMIFPKKIDYRFESIRRCFLRASFGTDSVLFVLLESKYKMTDYLEFWTFRQMPLLFLDEVDLNLVMSQIDCFIASKDHEAELSIIEMAWKRKIEIVGAESNPEEIFKNLPLTSDAELMRHEVQRAVEKIIKQFPMDQYQYLLGSHTMGECIALFFALREYRQQIRKKIIIFAKRDAESELYRLCPYCNVVVEQAHYLIYLYLNYFMDVKDLYEIYLDKPSLEDKVTLQDESDISTDDQPLMFKLIRNWLGMKSRITRYNVQLPKSAVESAQIVFDQMKLKRGKTVFISDGSAAHNLDNHPEFCVELVDAFRATGFDIVTNSKEVIIPNVRNVFLPILETSAFIGLCGNVVTSPTGWIEASLALNEVSSINAFFIFPGVHDYSKNIHKKEKYDVSPIFIKDLQKNGDNLIELWIQDYTRMMKSFCSDNVNFYISYFPETLEAERLLIKLIVQKFNESTR